MLGRIAKVGIEAVAAAAVVAATGGSALAATAPFRVLHSFAGTDGGSPNSLVQAANGTIYGAAANGGDTTTCSGGCGVLFRTDTAGSFAILHTFHATDGYGPTGVVIGKDGNFYGTTTSGGQPSGGGAGVLFRMDSAGRFTVLHAFLGGFACCDGGGPTARPVQGSDGDFYGTTGAGGAFRDIHHQGGFGTVYKFDPVTGQLSILHSFNLADGNGIYPNGPLIQARDGFFYGTTSQGGPGGATLFKIDGAGNFSRVAVLPGTQPLSGVIQASDGNFYGTDEGIPGAGTVYRVTPGGAFSVVNQFDGGGGYRPNFRVIQASDGLLYGTTPQGGLLDFQGGELFRLNLNGTLTVLHSFTTTNRVGGYSPNSDLIQGQDGALYGATGIGGANGSGTIFRYDQSIPGTVASISVNPSAVVYPDRSTGTVMLSAPAPAGGTTVSLFAQQGQIVIPSTVTIPAGASRASFSIQTMSIMASTNVRIYAAVTGQGVRTTITVLPAPKLSSLTLTPTSVRGSQTSTGTVRLSGPAPNSGAVVSLASNSTLASTVRSVKVAGGATSAAFTITTTSVGQSSPVTISASFNGTQKSAVLTILP